MTSDFSYWALMALGTLSFFLTGLSYAQRGMMRLRLLAVVALILGLAYNTWTHMLMPEGQNLWPSIIALSIFLVQNIWITARDLVREVEVELPPSLKEMMVKSFPGMHSRDWKDMLSLRRMITLKPGERLVGAGDLVESLYIVESGELTEKRQGHADVTRRRGDVWGEMSYVIDDPSYAAAPWDILAGDSPARVYAIPFASLRELERRSDRFAGSLRMGLCRLAAIKYGLVQQSQAEGVPDELPAPEDWPSRVASLLAGYRDRAKESVAKPEADVNKASSIDSAHESHVADLFKEVDAEASSVATPVAPLRGSGRFASLGVATNRSAT